MKITFLGAAGSVTGSKALVESGSTRVLVDCGLYQGVKAERLRNWRPMAVEPSSLDAIVLTHAHIDHSGLLPLLVRNGFEGPVYLTPPSAELSRILLPDAAYIQEEDASYANRRGISKHHPALPLYTRQDADAALEQLRPHEFGVERRIGDLTFEFRTAGHILGAASVEIRDRKHSVLFSGDLGRSNDLLMYPPQRPRSYDAIVIESTYGDRNHLAVDPIRLLASILEETLSRGGTLLIPAFAVGRAQTLLYCFHEIARRGLAPRVPIYVNSPMATSVTELFRDNCEYHRLKAEQCQDVFGAARFVRSVEESRSLVERIEKMVIISASGMASGGRVLHHLKALAPDPRNTILLPGFQAPGTRGDALARGIETIKIHGERYPVRARVRQLDVLSAHADQDGLLDWLASADAKPKQVFVNHGESVPADTIRQLTTERLGIPAIVPDLGDTMTIG